VTKQGLSAIVSTAGNDACHVILRGSKEGANFDPETVDGVTAALEAKGCHNRVMIDCSHGNSAKDFRKQPLVAEAVADRVAAGARSICGIMLESHLVEGRQDLGDDPRSLHYGQSITDACISWEATVPILERMARAVRERRGTGKDAAKA